MARGANQRDAPLGIAREQRTTELDGAAGRQPRSLLRVRAKIGIGVDVSPAGARVENAPKTRQVLG